MMMAWISFLFVIIPHALKSHRRNFVAVTWHSRVIFKSRKRRHLILTSAAAVAVVASFDIGDHEERR